MPVVGVGSMRMIVGPGIVAMHVTVRAHHRGLVPMVVMAIVVPVSVLVLDRLVGVTVIVPFGEMKIDAHSEERGRHDGDGSRRPIAHRPSRGGPHEGGKREDRACATGTDPALREKVEAKAESVASRSDRDEPEGGCGLGELVAQQ